MKRISLIISAVFALMLHSADVHAQQDAMFTQYMFNGLALNPAYAGSHEAIRTTFLHRNQWTQIDGAPNTTTLSIHTPANERIGLGFQLAHDKIGVSQQTVANISGAYMMPLSGSAKLSFGLSIGLDNLQYNYSDLDLYSTNDVFFDASNNINESKMNVGAGLFYHSDKTFVGISVPKLLENEYGEEVASVIQSRHYFIYAGHIIDLHPNLKFKPNVLFKAVEGAPLEADLNANFLFIDRIWAGVSWRSFESIGLMTQLNVTEQFGIGYAYDIVTNDIVTSDNKRTGSHEFMLTYLFSFKKKAMLSPRYF